MCYPKIALQAGKEVAVQRLHPWIFSGAIAKKENGIQDGDLVEVTDKKGNYLCTGHYYEGSIAIKIVSFEPRTIDADFWKEKLESALRVRKMAIPENSQTNCFRWIHGEGDGFPGLIVDYYDGAVVFQAHSIGMWKEKEKIVIGMCEVLNNSTRFSCKSIYDKSRETLPENFAKTVRNDYLFTDNSITVPHPVLENGNKFLIDWVTGQKTGFFLDQRDNRALLAHYASNKKVLNAFCYSGGFSIYALHAEANLVHSVDVSKKAIDLVNQNVEANFRETTAHQAFVEDVMNYLKNNDQFYDVIILDPPAFAKSRAKRHNAVQGYKRLNSEGLKRLGKGGILFTFSCSQVVDKQLFQDTVVAAALEVGRSVRILHHLTQGADHPVSLFHPEGSYLKGLVLYVE